jgi:branched-chain amino acid transport system ATP-binding protein
VISCVFAHPPIAQDKKLTIVLIEHDMRVVFHLADRITMLAEGTPQEIAANEAVQAAYLGEAAA